MGKLKYYITIIFINICVICVSQKHSISEKYIESYNLYINKYDVNNLKVAESIKKDCFTIINEAEPCSDSLIILSKTYCSDDLIVFKHNEYCIEFQIDTFFVEKNKIKYKNEKILYVNNQVKIGTRYDLPKNVLEKVNYYYNDIQVPFNKGFYENIFNLNIMCSSLENCSQDSGVSVFFNPFNEIIFIVINAGDGGSFCTSMLLFNRGKYLGKLLYTP